MLDVAWLRDLNTEYRAQGIEPGQRPWLAMRDLAVQRGIGVAIPSADADAVFDYFAVHAPSKTSRIGPLGRAAYYFDARFWPLEIPLFFGTCRLEPLTSLRGMPEGLKAAIAASGSARTAFVEFWFDCLDYATARPCVDPGSFGTRFIAGAAAELQAAVSQLLERVPNPRSALAARMATELHLKGFLTARGDLSDSGARGIGHDLEVALNRCMARPLPPDLGFLGDRLQRFPRIEDRYKDYRHSSLELWECYSLAQRTGAEVVRAITGGDHRRGMGPR